MPLMYVSFKYAFSVSSVIYSPISRQWPFRASGELL